MNSAYYYTDILLPSIFLQAKAINISLSTAFARSKQQTQHHNNNTDDGSVENSHQLGETQQKTNSRTLRVESMIDEQLLNIDDDRDVKIADYSSNTRGTNVRRYN